MTTRRPLAQPAVCCDWAQAGKWLRQRTSTVACLDPDKGAMQIKVETKPWKIEVIL